MQHEKETRRRVWHCLYTVDRLVALQPSGAVILRDSDFIIELLSKLVQHNPRPDLDNVTGPIGIGEL